MYTLTRTLPDGTVKKHEPVLTVAHAARAASYVLHYNARVSKAEAQRFAAALARKPLGTEWSYMTSGYSFRINHTDGD